MKKMILQLLAAGRIDAAQAERLIVAASAEREAAWAMAACAVIAVAAQLQWLVPQLVPQIAHAVREVGVPVLERVLGLV